MKTYDHFSYQVAIFELILELILGDYLKFQSFDNYNFLLLKTTANIDIYILTFAPV